MKARLYAPMTRPTSMSPLQRRARSLALLAVLAGAWGCGDQAPPPPDYVRLEPLELRLAEEAGPAPAVEVYRRIEPLPDAGWIVEADEPHVFATRQIAGSERPCLGFARVGELDVSLAGPFDPAQFDVLQVELVAGLRRRFEVRFHRGNGYARAHGATRQRDGAEVLEFPVPPAARSWKRIKGISLHSEDEPRRLELLGMELLRRPPATRLPVAEEGERHITSGGDARRGMCLLPGRPVECEFEVPRGGELRFSFAVPAVIAAPKLDTVLRLVVGEPGEEGEEHLFPIDPQRPLAWRTPRVPLLSFEGERVRARWEVRGEVAPGCVVAEPGLLHPGGEPRRVLLITSDTHRYDHLGTAGRGVEIQTPALDALSGSGLHFEDCFSSTNVTNPSHVSLMTGRSPRDTGIRINNAILSEEAPTLAEAFQQAGFVTYSSVSIKHLSPGLSGLGQGFDRSASPQRSRSRDAERTVEQALEWLDQSSELSVFLWLHLFDAHTPYETEDSFTQLYYEEPEAAYDPAREFAGEVPEVVRDVLYPELRDIELPRAQYKAEISYLDTHLGSLLAHPSLQDAIIGFTADHGESLGAHGIYFSHDALYLDSIHVPLILRFPGGPAGVRSRAPVEQIDLGRTLLDLAGLVGADFPGRNLLERLGEGAGEGPPRFALSAHQRSASITREGWHLILNLGDKGGVLTLEDPVLHSVELYELSADPGCERDLLDREEERARRLRRELVAWLLDAQHLDWDAEVLTDAETIAELEALGYAAGAAQEGSARHAPLLDVDCSCRWCERFR